MPSPVRLEIQYQAVDKTTKTVVCQANSIDEIREILNLKGIDIQTCHIVKIDFNNK